jgi:hypothetical protein
MKKICFALFTALAIASADAAKMQWSSPPTTLSTSNQNASSARMATAANGNLVAVWLENGFVHARINTGQAGWGSSATLSGMNSSSPCVVSDPNSNITVIWNEGGLIKAVSHPSGGNWSSTTTISSSGSSAPTLGVDSAGNVVAAWVSSNGTIRSSTKLSGGNWSGQSTLSSAAGTVPHVAMGGSGSNATTVVVWQGVSGEFATVMAASKVTSGSWSAQVTISDTTGNAAYPRVAVDGNGHATAIWYKYDLINSIYSNVTVTAANKVFSKSWATSVEISSGGMRDPSTLVAKIAYDQFGNAIALWNNSYDGATFNVESAVKRVGQKWSAPVVAVEQNDYSYAPDLAVCSLGDAHASYMFYNGQYLFIRASENDITGFIPSEWAVPINIGLGTDNGFSRIVATLSNNTVYTGALWLTQNGSNQNVVAVTGVKSLVLPPTSLSVTQSLNDFGVFPEYKNTISWTASTDDNANGYAIYRNGVFIAEVDASTTSYVDHNAKQSGSVTYGVATVDYQQDRSTIVLVNYP